MELQKREGGRTGEQNETQYILTFFKLQDQLFWKMFKLPASIAHFSQENGERQSPLPATRSQDTHTLVTKAEQGESGNNM